MNGDRVPEDDAEAAKMGSHGDPQSYEELRCCLRLEVPRDEDENTAKPVIRVVQNWYEEFRDREQD